MKIRPVTCIHVAAYLFSALVLGTSAVSYYRAIGMGWTSGHRLNLTFINEGCFILLRAHDDVWSSPFYFCVLETIVFRALIESVIYHSGTIVNGSEASPLTMPLWSFLLPPMTWMCGFHLVRLRRRWRTERNFPP